MPSFKLPSIPIRGLREMSGDDIKGVLSDVRAREVRVPEVHMPDVHMPDVRMSDLDPRKLDLSKVDLSKLDVDLTGLSSAMSAAAATAAERNPLRRRRPSRLPYVIAGLIVAALAIIVVRNASWIRSRADEVGQKIRERSEADRVDGSLEQFATDEDSFSADVAIPIEPDPYAESLPSAESGYPTASEELVESAGDRMSSDRLSYGDELAAEREYRFPAS